MSSREVYSSSSAQETTRKPGDEKGIFLRVCVSYFGYLLFLFVPFTFLLPLSLSNLRHENNISGGMAAMFKQVIALYIIAPLCFVVLMLPMVLCGSDSQATPISYKPISNITPPCSETRQENCVTYRPPANDHQRPCNPSDHCHGVKSLTGSESMSKAQVSAATIQFGVQDHTLLRLGFAMEVGSMLVLFHCLVCFWYGIHV